MIHSVRFKAVLDTNVIHPIVVRDLLFWFAHYDMYTPKWKALIVEKGQSESEAERRVNIANRAFPDALVGKYENLIEGLVLPDLKDRHVLAAAIKTNANIIVTNNLKDFPLEYLDTFGIKAISPDDFLTDIIDLNPEEALKAFREMVINKKNPEMHEFEVLDVLRKSGLIDTANYLHALL